MTNDVSGVFNYSDRMLIESLKHRLKRTQVIGSNVANAETPGFRALGYDFEEQLQALQQTNDPLNLKTNDPRHRIHPHASADGQIKPDVFVRPTETVGHDGNTVDVDGEMAELAHNQILYRTAVETLNRKIGLIKYAVQGGR